MVVDELYQGRYIFFCDAFRPVRPGVLITAGIATIRAPEIALLRHIDDERVEVRQIAEWDKRLELESGGTLTKLFTITENNLISPWRIVICVAFCRCYLHQIINDENDNICMTVHRLCNQSGIYSSPWLQWFPFQTSP